MARPRTAAIQKAEIQNTRIKAGEKDLRFVLSNDSKPVWFGGHQLTHCILFDPETKKQRRARYVEGATSYWEDQQPQGSKRTPIEFIDGFLFVSKDNIGLQQYLLDRMYYENERMGENACMYKIDDPIAQSRQVLNSRKLIYQAQSLIFDKSDTDAGREEVCTVARAYGINVSNAKEAFDVVQRQLLEYADKEPQRVIESFDNPRVKNKSLILLAREMDVLQFNEQARTVVLSSTGKRVNCPIPMGVDPVDALTDYTLTEEGSALVEYINTAIAE